MTKKFRFTMLFVLCVSFSFFFFHYAFAAEPIKSIGVCSGKKTSDFLITDWELKKIYFHQHDRANFAAVPRPMSGDCVELGAKYNLIDWGFRDNWGTVTITHIVKLQNPTDWKPVAAGLNMPEKYVKDYLGSYFGQNTLTNQYYLVHFSFKPRDYKDDRLTGYTTAIAKFVPVITVVTPEMVGQKPDKNTLIIDVREPSDYKTDHIPGAINVPYTVKGIGKYYSYYVDPLEWETVLEKDQFDWSKLPKDKEFIFYGINEFDAKPKRIAEKLIFLGYKNAKWLRTGYSGWKNISIEIPPTHPHINIITISQLKKMMASPVTLVDVGLSAFYKQPYFWHSGRIPKSINIPYITKNKELPFSVLMQPPKEAQVKIRALGDKWNLSVITKSKPLVLYAWSHTELLALRAALLAKADGYDVYLFRDGFSQWDARARFDPVNFPVEMSKLE